MFLFFFFVCSFFTEQHQTVAVFLALRRSSNHYIITPINYTKYICGELNIPWYRVNIYTSY